jgi:hypothetical protein
MKILIVYALVPEENRFYHCDVSDEDWKWIKLTHDNLVNSVALDEKPAEIKEACLRLDRWLNERTPLDVSEGPIALEGTVCFIHTGFIL